MKTLTIPEELLEQVSQGAVLAISISGGKDSQALLKAVIDWYRSEGLTNPVFAIHADLGRSECTPNGGRRIKSPIGGRFIPSMPLETAASVAPFASWAV